MTDNKRRISYLIANAFPGNYFLDNAVILKANVPSPGSWRPLGASELNDPRRLERRVWDAIRRSSLAHGDPIPLPPNPKFEFIDYDRIEADVGYPTFVCTNHRCEKVYTLEQVRETNFRCPDHPQYPLAQMAHLFVHSDCGRVTLVREERCSNMVEEARCNTPLRLHIAYQRMDQSYWWCPRCKALPSIPARAHKQQDGTWSAAWQRPLQMYCYNCPAVQPPQQANAGANPEMNEVQTSGTRSAPLMRLVQARSVFQLQKLDLVDLGSADIDAVLAEWFGGSIDLDEIRRQLPPFVLQAFDENPAIRRDLVAQYAQNQQRAAAIPSISQDVMEEIHDYAGARSVVLQHSASNSIQVQTVLNRFGLSVALLDDLGIVQASYGYLIGSADAAQAKLAVFGMGGDQYAVLTQRIATEGLLIEASPDRIEEWLHNSGLIIPGGHSEQALRRHLVTAPADDPVLQRITTLLHTLSHILIRSSERYTGIGRDTMSELIWPRTLAFCLYNQRGSELGMLTTTFEGRLGAWFEGALYDARNCPFDPVCASDPAVAACMGCLHLSRCHAPFWNRELDRRCLSSLGFGATPGYWESLTP